MEETGTTTLQVSLLLPEVGVIEAPSLGFRRNRFFRRSSRV